MFLFTDGTIVTSASDLTLASKCEFAFLRRLDELRGRTPKVASREDALLERAARLGDQHEERVLAQYKEDFGSGVRVIARPNQLTREGLSDAARVTRQALSDGADVVFQATFLDEDSATGTAFIGFADFIARQSDGAYRVEDTKLARSAKVTALLQLSAYAEQLARQSVTVDRQVSLLLGDGTESKHYLDDISPVYRLRRRRLVDLVTTRETEGTAGEPVAWGDSRYSICGTCEACDMEIVTHQDVLQVANLRRAQRERLNAAGIRTVRELAESDASVEGIGQRALQALRRQASLQLTAAPASPPPYDLIDPTAIVRMPPPDPGDIFFDFEGDPLYTEQGGAEWGLDYLFGLVEADGTFKAFWAHSFAEEGTALREFLAYLHQRRAKHPGMHIYHYASYERTHLANLAIRHGYGEDIVDDLFRQHVLVDLYPIVRASLVVGSPSYSIKKLEPLYMGEDLRDEEGVTTAGDSIAEYARAIERRDSGDHDEYASILASIQDYNEYDCRSTLKLRDWLKSLVPIANADSPPVAPPPREVAERDAQATLIANELLGLAGDPLTVRSDPRRQALALAASAVGYHAREDKKTWWEHFARLLAPVDEWIDTRGVFEVTSVEIDRDWFKEGKQRVLRRRLRLVGNAGPGSLFKASDRANAFLIYAVDADAPRDIFDEPGARVAREATIADVTDGELTVVEALRTGEDAFMSTPIALGPGRPVQTDSLRDAIREWGVDVLRSHPDWPTDAAADVLLRRPPRLTSGVLAPSSDIDPATLAETIRNIERSYLALQGPPGTGKTFIGSRAVAELVTAGWKVGVTAQSHAVIDNFLGAAMETGLDPALICHVGGDGVSSYASVASKDIAAWLAESAHGCLVGATAWAFSNPKQVDRRQLDLLVIDEAGQFSLANTIAAASAADRVLLLGDPQQLPQVTQGSHPQPIDESALGWIAGGESVLRPEFGYFLSHTRRMSAELTAMVSRHSYRGALHAHECTHGRSLEGVAAGLHTHAVQHRGNSVSSSEEAAAVLDIIDSLVGKGWTDPGADRHATPLRSSDIIVVTPYNAQREMVHQALAAAGFADVEVGTVDKFQGKEAVVSIVTLAASDASEVPRGMEFLINRNRLNVAISRAQWASWLVCSPALTEHLPTSVDGLAELSAFAKLLEESVSDGRYPICKSGTSDASRRGISRWGSRV